MQCGRVEIRVGFMALSHGSLPANAVVLQLLSMVGQLQRSPLCKGRSIQLTRVSFYGVSR